MVSGGTSMFPGFPTRIENDMVKLYKENILKGKEYGAKSKIQIKIIVRKVLDKIKFFLGSCKKKI